MPTVFQRLFKTICALFTQSESVARFDSGTGERVSRFLTDRNQYSSPKNIVRHTAFFPPKDLRLSVYWTTRISEQAIWDIGQEFIAPSRGPIHGRGDINSLGIAREAGLAIELTGIPHARHAEIFRWDADRAKVRLQAAKLADKARLVLVPKGP